MVNLSETKQDQSRHFGFKPKAQESSGFVANGATRTITKESVSIPSTHISRYPVWALPVVRLAIKRSVFVGTVSRFWSGRGH